MASQPRTGNRERVLRRGTPFVLRGKYDVCSVQTGAVLFVGELIRVTIDNNITFLHFYEAGKKQNTLVREHVVSAEIIYLSRWTDPTNEHDE